MVVYTDTKYLTADTRSAVQRLMDILNAKGLNPRIVYTYRSPETQLALFKEAQANEAWNKANPDQPKRPVPTKTLHSWHENGRGVDIDISPLTSEGSSTELDNVFFFLQTALSLGFHINPSSPDPPYIDMNNLWDWHHLEYRNGRATWEQAMNEYNELGLAPGSTAMASIGDGGSGLLTLGIIGAGLYLLFGRGV